MTVFALTGLAIPEFLLGHATDPAAGDGDAACLPPSGYVPFSEDPVENLKLMIMPALALGWARPVTSRA